MDTKAPKVNCLVQADAAGSWRSRSKHYAHASSTPSFRKVQEQAQVQEKDWPGCGQSYPPLGVLGAKMSGVQKGWGAGDPPEGRFIRSTFLSPGRFLQPLQTYLSLSSVFRHSQKGRPDTVVITV